MIMFMYELVYNCLFIDFVSKVLHDCKIFAEVDSYRLELEDIKVRGKGCPKPIKTWAQCGVSKKTLDCLKK